MSIEWIIPTMKQAYKNREVAFSVWNNLLKKLLGPKSKIAFVGPEGVGKSVLLDHITGRAAETNYTPPSKSRKTEYGKARNAENRLAFVVSPGQGGPKVDAFQKIFKTKSAVDGVVIVVGNGFTSPRNESATEANIARGYKTITAWRKLQIESELEYLQDICTQIRSTKRFSSNPKWIMVAVTKTDLYYDEISTIRDYYSPHGNSEFSNILNKLKEQVGSDNIEWDAAPVCSQLDEYIWGEESIKSKLNKNERDYYLTQFLNRIGELCQEN